MAKLRRVEVEEAMTMCKLGNGKCSFHASTRSSLRLAILASLFGLIVLVTHVSGGTIPNRRTGAVDTSILEISTQKPSSGRNMRHPAFANAGRSKGTEIWRIENFEPVRYPTKDYGKFYTGDSYIILNTKENKNKDLSWDIHFWLGSETSTDEAGAAAILTVQLDDSLNGDPIEHREVQDHESQLFLGYFKNVDVVGGKDEPDSETSLVDASKGKEGDQGDGGKPKEEVKPDSKDDKGDGGAGGAAAEPAKPEPQPEPEAPTEEPQEPPEEPEQAPEVEPDPDAPDDDEDVDPRQAGGEHRPRKQSYRIPRYSAELITPSKLFKDKHNLSKSASKVSLDRVSPKSSLQKLRNRLSRTSQKPSAKASSSRIKPSDEKNLKAKSNHSIVTFGPNENELLINNLEGDKARKATNLTPGRSGDRKAGGYSPRTSTHATQSNYPYNAPRQLANPVPQQSVEPNQVSPDLSMHRRKPPMDDSAAGKIEKNPRPATVPSVVKPNEKDGRRSSSSFRMPTGDERLKKTASRVPHRRSGGGTPDIGRPSDIGRTTPVSVKRYPTRGGHRRTSKRDEVCECAHPNECSMDADRSDDSIRYEKGGVASGFQHAEINEKGAKRLFQVKGKRNVRVRQVNLSISSMNRGDCFILDAGDEIYVYVGSSSKRVEKLKAISAANQIRDQDHRGRAKVHIIDDFSSLFDKEEFFKILGSGSPDQVPTESVAEEDGEFERNDERAVTLYKISDETGSLKVDTISQKPLKQEMLDTKDCFILDTGSGIFVWVGKGATQQEKTQAMAKAQGFLQLKKYPAWTNIERIVEGAETAPFKQYFATWRDVGMAHTRLIRAANDDDSDTAEDEEFDPAILHALKKSGGRAIGFMPDNGDGKLEAVYRIENFELAELTPEMYGMLFGGDSYVVKYHYINKRGGQGYVLYYWQGKESSLDEKAAAALHALKLDNELNGTAVQVRVAQGFEPRHFLKVFQGKLITFIGGHASGFKNVDNPETYEANGSRLFRVRGTCKEDVRADQRPAVTSSLASDDVFILETPDIIFVWKGVGASDFEKEMAASVVERIGGAKDRVEIDEGSEPSEFWDVLGGEGDYDKVLDPAYPPFLEPRLFHCRILANGRFKVEEIHHFEQEDLDVDDIMVLDGGDEIYVWVGDGSTAEEREKSIDMAKQYIRTDPSERSEETVPLVKIMQGNEPRSFKRLFPAWDDDVWQSIPTYESMKEQVLHANSLIGNEV